VTLFFRFDRPGQLIQSHVTADSSGNLSAQIGDTCPTSGVALISVYATGTTAQNQPVQTPVVDDPCFKSNGR
jgi:hypothetical protein